ncbi:MAG: UvrD-helicase domain-containing protein [Desulfocapsaceae bacterium]|nr:UvrD-helicase domain-containing protein [Desulfocapsaceae bacterium]
MNIEIISASAGSGKTYKLAELLEAEVGKDGGVRPDAILATTFTKKAAAELQERVRTKLLTAGLTVEAQQLSASRIGTVNSVCGQLLSDFAFELGISPAQKVIEEEAVSAVISRSMARVIDRGTQQELKRLGRVFVDTDTHEIIEQIIAKARANGLYGKDLLSCGQRSAAGFKELFGPVADNGKELDENLVAGLDSFLQQVDPEVDSTNDTNKALDHARRLKGRLAHQGSIPWSEWHRLAVLKTGAKSRQAAEDLHVIAGCHDIHPQLQKDADRLITLVFELAAKVLDSYQEYKREWGVVDFVDQEVLTLELLAMEHVRELLSENLDLVLVDEFQDTSPIQLAIFLKLASLAKKSVWVGDQKQAIYGFRDADPALMDAAITGILKGDEPETLRFSWRSRPELVRSTSDIFVKAFASQGLPAKRVHLEPALAVVEKQPEGLGPVYEYWQLESTNKDKDALALAASVKEFLDDPDNTIIDQKTDKKRRARGGDVAILCRENDICVQVVEALEKQGIQAALPRPGLLKSPEAILVMAGIRLIIDPKDSLARAEISRLLDNPTDHNQWLYKALSKPYGQGFDLELFDRLAEARQNLSLAGPLQVLDAAMSVISVREHCLAWGDSKSRLANLDSLRALCVSYVDHCQGEGRGASPAGMLIHLEKLENDTRAVVRDDETVHVLTWHKAKGLEWPVTVLYQLDKVFPALPLGVSVIGESDFQLEDPLADRWLRYWPNPYGNFKTGAPFHERLTASPAALAKAEQEGRQDLRLLYVGWTRARDKVVLAGRAGSLQKGILRLLMDNQNNHLLENPEDGNAVWAGREIDIVMRSNKPADPLEKTIQPSTGYLQGTPKEYPPAFLAASSIVGVGIIGEIEDLGERLPLSGQPDVRMLGEAIHTFLGADNVGYDKLRRLTMAEDVLKRWFVAKSLDAQSLLIASDRLHSWVTQKWPSAIWHREYPIALRQENGTIINGFIDLLLEIPEGYLIVDHKSFAGNAQEAQKKAASFAGQLGVYAEAVAMATGRNVTGTWIHLPVIGASMNVQ